MSAHESIILSLDNARDKINTAKADAKSNRNDAALQAALDVLSVQNVILRTIVRSLQGDERSTRELSEGESDG